MAGRSAHYLETEYQLPTTSVNRHAHAKGWYEERQRNSISLLDRLIEEGEEKGKVGRATMTGTNLLKAMELRARLSGELIERVEQRRMFDLEGMIGGGAELRHP